MEHGGGAETKEGSGRERSTQEAVGGWRGPQGRGSGYIRSSSPTPFHIPLQHAPPPFHPLPQSSLPCSSLSTVEVRIFGAWRGRRNKRRFRKRAIDTGSSRRLAGPERTGQWIYKIFLTHPLSHSPPACPSPISSPPSIFSPLLFSLYC